MDYVQRFCETVTEQSKNEVSLEYTTYNELDFSVVDGKISVYDHKNKRDLRNYSFVHFKNWTFEMEMAGVAARYLDERKVPYANTEVRYLPSLGKISQMFTMACEGIAVPDTLLASHERLMAMFTENTNQDFKFPLIVKSNDASKGADNYLVKNIERLQEVLENNPGMPFLVQNYIPNKGDLRILFIGTNNTPLVFKRTASANGGHLNNTSQGGKGELLDYGELDISIKRDAHKAALVTRREISGVDVITDEKTGKYYILEVNATPALATGFGQKEKISKFLDFLSSEVELAEEEE